MSISVRSTTRGLREHYGKELLETFDCACVSPMGKSCNDSTSRSRARIATAYRNLGYHGATTVKRATAILTPSLVSLPNGNATWH